MPAGRGLSFFWGAAMAKPSKAITITANAAIRNARAGSCRAAKLLVGDLKRLPKRTRAAKNMAAEARVIVGHLCKGGLGYVYQGTHHTWKAKRRGGR